MNDTEKKRRKYGREKALGILSGTAAFGIISIIAYSIIIQEALFAGATVIVALASCVTGGLAGFLFGIPKTNQFELNGHGPARKEANIHYQFNTNLEQISDWLTKILIGVGLTQIHALGGALHQTAKYFVKDMGIKGLGASSVLTVTTVYFLICGFMIGYLWTRLFYHRLLATADRGVFDTLNEVNDELQEVNEELREVNDELQEVRRVADSAASAATMGVGKSNSTVVTDETKSRRLLQLEEGFGSAKLAPITNANDPNCGRFGGKAKANDRKLTAKINAPIGNEGWFNVLLCVESTNPLNPLSGMVRFYLHDTFQEPIVDVKVKHGFADLDPVAFGAFTVGAIADDGKTLLELNLKDLPNAPKKFRNR